MVRAGDEKLNVRFTTVNSSLDQLSRGPNGVAPQSKARTRSAISPVPMIRDEGGADELFGNEEESELADVISFRIL
jgi:hypothetical protein